MCRCRVVRKLIPLRTCHNYNFNVTTDPLWSTIHNGQQRDREWRVADKVTHGQARFVSILWTKDERGFVNIMMRRMVGLGKNILTGLIM